MKLISGWLKGTLRRLPWLIIGFALRVPEKLLDDRITGWANHQLDAKTGAIMGFLS